jgi:hypothetical protein
MEISFELTVSPICLEGVELIEGGDAYEVVEQIAAQVTSVLKHHDPNADAAAINIRYTHNGKPFIEVPEGFAMFSAAGNQLINAQARQLVNDLYALESDDDERVSFRKFFLWYHRQSWGNTEFPEMSDTAVREAVWAFAAVVGEQWNIRIDELDRLWHQNADFASKENFQRRDDQKQKKSGKVYSGTRSDLNGCNIVVIDMSDGSQYDLDPRNDLMNHSPDGFNWGYGGSGPSQTALAIMADHCGGGENEALARYQAFKRVVVSDWEDTWTITTEQINKVLTRIDRGEI